MTFDENPCRRSAFDAFPVATDEISIKIIRRVISQTRADWKDSKGEDGKGKLPARDGSVWELTEARLVNLEETILDPVQRLQVEQFVHKEHVFALDDESAQIAAEVRALANYGVLPPQVLQELEQGILSDLGRFVPGPEPALVRDDLPWPKPPSAFAVDLESYQETILCER
jgi:hypothetical protein